MQRRQLFPARATLPAVRCLRSIYKLLPVSPDHGIQQAVLSVRHTICPRRPRYGGISLHADVSVLIS